MYQTIAIFVPRIILISITVLVLGQKEAKQSVDEEILKGHPIFIPCNEKFEIATKNQISPNQTLQIFVNWSHIEETKNYPNILVDNYTWSWKVVKIINVEEMPIHVDANWIKDGGVLFEIPPYALGPGYYKIYPNATPSNPGLHIQYTKACLQFIRALVPVAIISGGNITRVRPHTDIVLSAEGSYDTNTKKPTTDALTYAWWCQQTPPRNYCERRVVSTDKSLTIPARYVIDGDYFNVTLNVSANANKKGSLHSWAIVTQSFDVIDERSKTSTTFTPVPSKEIIQLEIVCEKNCPPVAENPNCNSITFLSVKCTSNCQNIADDDYEWSIESNKKDFQFDYVNDTQFGRFCHKFIVKRNVLEVGEYTFRVRLRESAEKKGEAVRSLKFPGPPGVKACVIEPDVGFSIETMFKLVCEQEDPDEKNFYELYALEDEGNSTSQLIVDGFYPAVQDKEFMLPTSDMYSYVVKVSNEAGDPRDVHVDAFVQKRFEDPNKLISSVRAILSDVSNNESISNQLLSQKKEERDEAIQKLQSIVNEVVDNDINSDELHNFVEELKHEIVDDVMKASLTSVNEVMQMTDIVAKLMGHNVSEKSDPLLAKFATTICRKMIAKHIQLVQMEKHPLLLAEKAAKISTALTKCLESNTDPDYDILQPIFQNITTAAPVFSDALITENYANYVDFSDKYYEHLGRLKESTYNILKSSADSAKVTALTTAIGENFVETIGTKSATIVAKDYGRYLYKRVIRSNNITLYPSRDLANDEHPYDILMTTWTTDIMWWNPQHIQVATDIASIEVWHSTCKNRIKRFKEPARLFFKLTKNVRYAWVSDAIRISQDPLINVRRVAVAKKQTLHVQFITDHMDAFEVVLTNFYYPTIQDFSGNKAVNFLTLINDKDYDIWCYVGVLLKDQIKSNETSINYQLGFAGTSCMRWLESYNSWISNCIPSKYGNRSFIGCECNRFSVLAGYMQMLKSEPQEILIPDLELKLVATHIIFVVLTLTLGIYCIALIFSVTKRQKEVYYLADNNRTHRYAYVIIVQTGLNRNSGTTSNVAIKLIGSTHASEAHILNYPDPKMKLLQRYNTDIFILTTEQYLGDLKRIELWFDSLGYHPDWYCKDVIVYDMQRNVDWHFHVNERLDVRKGRSFCAVPPTETKTKRTKPISFHWTLANHTWYLCDYEDNYSHLKKSTVIVSTILMTYVGVLLYHGMPTLQLQNEMDIMTFSVDASVLGAAVMGALPAFTVHTIIAWSFRYSKVQFPQYSDGRALSHETTIICWCCLVLFMSGSTCFLVIFGFWVPFNCSLRWLVSCVLGVVLGAVVYEGLFLFFQNYLCKFNMLQSVRERILEVRQVTEQQRLFLYSYFGDGLLRPYFQHLYQPMKSVDVKQKKVLYDRRRFVADELADLIMFSLYTILLYLLLLPNKDIWVLRSKIVMEEIVRGLHVRRVGFHELESTHQIYEFLNLTIIPSLQPTHWYANFVVSEPGLIIDMSNKYLGVVRLRQLRVQTNSCLIPDVMEFTNSTCTSEFSRKLVDTRSRGYGWGALTEHLIFDRLRNIWKYETKHKTGTFSKIGEFSVYSGGGYLSFLGRTLYNSYSNLQRMVKRSWIDVNTRAVFVEFLTYTPNSNVFIAVQLLYERSASGLTIKNIQVNSARMLFVQNEIETMTFIFFIMFVVWVSLLCVTKIVLLAKKFRMLFNDVWFLIDVVIVVMSVTCIGLFFARMSMIGKYLIMLESAKKNNFLNYFYLFYLDDFLSIFAAFLVGFSTVRLWRFLRFAVLFRILERTISVAAPKLLTLSIVYCLLLYAFATTLVVLCGDKHQKIATLARTTRLLITIAFQAGELELGTYVDQDLVVFCIILYTIVIQVIVLLYVVIILTGYSEAQREFSSKMSSYNLKSYFHEQIQYLPKFLKYKYKCKRLKAGLADADRKVEPKSDKFVYSRCLIVSEYKLLAMKYITQSLIRNAKHSYRDRKLLTNYDAKLMLNVSHYFLFKSRDKYAIFFKGRVKGKRLAIVDEERISKIAKVVHILLQEHYVYTKMDRSQSLLLHQCIEAIRQNQDTLRNCELRLKLLLHELKSAEIKVVSKY